MLSWIREKFGTTVIGGIIGFIGFVFVFYGVFSPKSTRGLHEGAVAGIVNGDAVTLSEFNREFNRRVEMFKGFSGGKLTEEQIQGFHLKEMVFDDLVRRKVLIQEVKKQGLEAGDEQVRQAIREIPAFQKNGKFDVLTYKQVLEANQYNAGGFERLVRDDLSAQHWDRYFSRRTYVSAEEVRRQYVLAEDKRKIKYVLLTVENGRKLIQVSPDEVQKFLADANQLNLAKSQFEAKKETLYKGKAFDVVKEELARDLIAGNRIAEIQKANDELAEKVKPLLTASAASDAQVNALLKTVGAEVKVSDWVSRQNARLPGVGEITPVMKDAFSKTAPEAQAKKYALASGTLVAMVADTQKPDLSKFDEQREALFKELLQRKQREVYQNWLTGLTQGAKIEKNATVLGLDKS